MSILIFSVSLTIIAIFLHLILLRIYPALVKNFIIAVFFIFFIVLLIGFLSAYLLRRKYGFLPCGGWEDLHVLIFYIPVMLSYVITCVALVDDSPSMTIVGFVEQAKEKGRSRQQIRQIINDEALIVPRINIMAKDGWVELKNNQYAITKKGIFYSRILALGLKLLNISREG